MSFFSTLPEGIKRFIISFLPPEDIFAFSEVDKACNQLSKHEDIWKAAARSLCIINVTSLGAQENLRIRITKACSSAKIIALLFKDRVVVFQSTTPIGRYRDALGFSLNTFGRGCDSDSIDGKDDGKRLLSTLSSDIIRAAIAEEALVPTKKTLGIFLSLVQNSILNVIKKDKSISSLEKEISYFKARIEEAISQNDQKLIEKKQKKLKKRELLLKKIDYSLVSHHSLKELMQESILICEALIDAGATFSEEDFNTTLGICCHVEDTHLLKFLIEKGLKPNLGQKDSSLDFALDFGNLELIDIVLGLGGKPSSESIKILTRRCDLKMFKAMIEKLGLHPESESFLKPALRSGKMEIVQFALEKSQNQQREAKVKYAVQSRNLEVVEWAIKQNYQRAPEALHEAIKIGDLQVVNLLLAHEVPFDDQVLDLAIESSREIFEAVVNRIPSQEVRVISSDGLKKMVKGILKGDFSIEDLQMLVEFGVKVEHVSSAELNLALKDAFKTRNTKLLEFVVAIGALPNPKTLRLLKNCEDMTIFELVEMAARRINSENLRQLLSSSKVSSDPKLFVNFIRFLLDKEIINPSLLRQHIRQHGAYMHPRVLEELTKVDILEIEFVQEFFLQLLDRVRQPISSFMDALTSNQLVSDEFITKFINSPVILGRIFQAVENDSSEMKFLVSLFSAGTLDINTIKTFMTPRLLSAIFHYLTDPTRSENSEHIFDAILRERAITSELVSQSSEELNFKCNPIIVSMLFNYALNGESDYLEIFRAFIERGLRLEEGSPAMESDMVNRAAEHALKTGEKELLYLVIRAGALPDEKTDKLLKNCKDVALLSMIQKAKLKK
ncbi:MAG: hypothetical protein ACM3JI_03245 [Anaerolineae bacterium]